MDSERSVKMGVREFGRHPYDSMCGGFGCLYLREENELLVITDCGRKRSLGKHFLREEDDWGACSLGPILHRGDRFFLIREDGTEEFLFEERCDGWQGGVGCIYLVSRYNDFTRREITV